MLSYAPALLAIQSIQVFRAIVDSWKFYFHKYLLYRISLNGDVHIFTGELV